MRKLVFLFLFPLVAISCEKSNDQSKKSDIFFQELNKEFVLITDVELLQQSNDEISLRVDSILTGLLDVNFISSGEKKFDLNSDKIPDIAFEIIDLNTFNPQGMPAHLDTLAARVVAINVEIHDNSTWGYVSALNAGELITDDDYWTNRGGVLGTIFNAGQFQGRGDRFLAVRLPGDGGYNYGWIKIYCSQHSDTLRIIEYAYNTVVGAGIVAGQRE